MLGLNSKCWKLGESDNSVYFRRRAKWYQTKPNCLRMSSHFLRTKPVCQNRIYGRVENWINLSPFLRYNFFISTHIANIPFAWKTETCKFSEMMWRFFSENGSAKRDWVRSFPGPHCPTLHLSPSRAKYMSNTARNDLLQGLQRPILIPKVRDSP